MLEQLSTLQEEMARALRHDFTLSKDQKWSAFAQEQLCGSARLSPVQQLEIYREQFWLRHTGALLEDFPGLAGILGQPDWQRLAKQYLRERTPESYSLRDLGLLLPATIERATWLAQQALCLDMARLEIAYIEVFDAPDSEPLAPERLAGICEELLGECKFVIAPSVRLLSVRYPVPELRRQLRHADDAAVAMPPEKPLNLVIYRQSLRLLDMTLGDTAFALLKGLWAGRSLAEAAELAVNSPQREAELATSIGDWLSEWTCKGLLSGIVEPSLPDQAIPSPKYTEKRPEWEPQ